jgi:hypothetical protein
MLRSIKFLFQMFECDGTVCVCVCVCTHFTKIWKSVTDEVYSTQAGGFTSVILIQIYFHSLEWNDSFCHITEYVHVKYKDFAKITGCDFWALDKQKGYNHVSRIAVYCHSALICPHPFRTVQSGHWCVEQTTLQMVKNHTNVQCVYSSNTTIFIGRI